MRIWATLVKCCVFFLVFSVSPNRSAWACTQDVRVLQPVLPSVREDTCPFSQPHVRTWLGLSSRVFCCMLLCAQPPPVCVHVHTFSRHEHDRKTGLLVELAYWGRQTLCTFTSMTSSNHVLQSGTALEKEGAHCRPGELWEETACSKTFSQRETGLSHVSNH